MKFKQIVNCTPHDINMLCEGGKELVFAAPANETMVARVSMEERTIDYIEFDRGIIPVKIAAKVGAANIPLPQADTLFIVSNLVREYFPRRRDFISPAGAIRDQKGNIVKSQWFYINK